MTDMLPFRIHASTEKREPSVTVNALANPATMTPREARILAGQLLQAATDAELATYTARRG